MGKIMLGFLAGVLVTAVVIQVACAPLPPPPPPKSNEILVRIEPGKICLPDYNASGKTSVSSVMYSIVSKTTILYDRLSQSGQRIVIIDTPTSNTVSDLVNCD